MADRQNQQDPQPDAENPSKGGQKSGGGQDQGQSSRSGQGEQKPNQGGQTGGEQNRPVRK